MLNLQLALVIVFFTYVTKYFFTRGVFKSLDLVGKYLFFVFCVYQFPWLLAKVSGNIQFSGTSGGGSNQIIGVTIPGILIYPIPDLAILFGTIYYIVRLVSTKDKQSPSMNSICLLALIPFVSLISRAFSQGEYPNKQPLLVILIIFAVSISTTSHENIVASGTFLTLFAGWISCLIYFYNRDVSVLSCADKCTLFGNLMSGIFSHNNLMGIIISSGFSFVWLNFKGRDQFFFCSFILFLTYASGSRASYFSLLVQVAALIFIRKINLKQFLGHLKILTLRLFLLAATILSAFLPFVISSDQFGTGRGYLFRIAISYFNESPLIGRGSKFWTSQFNLGAFGQGSSYSPHNQLLDILLLSGIVGGLVFVYFIVRWITTSTFERLKILSPFLLGTVILGSAETPLSFGLATQTTTILILFMLIFISKEDKISSVKSEL